MFSYSPREKTRAAAFENQIPELEKKERLHRLIACSNKIVEKKNKDQVGTIQEILVEGFSKKNANRLTGRTRTNRIVVFDGSQEMIGTLQKIHIENGYSWGLEGNAAVSSYA